MVVSINGLLNSLPFDILSWEKFLKGEEAWFVLGFVVVAILDLTLEGGKMHGLVTSAGVSPINYGITRLDIEEVEPNSVVTINVLIEEEEFLPESKNICLLNALLTK